MSIKRYYNFKIMQFPKGMPQNLSLLQSGYLYLFIGLTDAAAQKMEGPLKQKGTFCGWHVASGEKIILLAAYQISSGKYRCFYESHKTFAGFDDVRETYDNKREDEYVRLRDFSTFSWIGEYNYYFFVTPEPVVEQTIFSNLKNVQQSLTSELFTVISGYVVKGKSIKIHINDALVQTIMKQGLPQPDKDVMYYFKKESSTVTDIKFEVCITSSLPAVPDKDGIAVVFNPESKLMDANSKDLQEAEDLNLPKSNPDEEWSLDGLVDIYAEKYGEQDLVKLWYILDENKGMGYKIQKAEFWFDSYAIDTKKKIIYIDHDELLSKRTNLEAAQTLKRVVEYEFEKKRTLGDHIWRITKGCFKTGVGLLTAGVGVVGLIAPEPTMTTKVAGVALVTFGGSTMVEGVTQIFNFTEDGFNPLGETFAKVGSLIGGEDGEQMARVAFCIADIVICLGGSYKVLKIPGIPLVFKGTYTGAKFSNYYKEGLTIGRLQLCYPFQYKEAGKLVKGFVYINVTNNSNQWVFRFEKVMNSIVMNGRIIGVKSWHRVKNPLEMVKVMIKLILKAN